MMPHPKRPSSASSRAQGRYGAYTSSEGQQDWRCEAGRGMGWLSPCMSPDPCKVQDSDPVHSVRTNTGFWDFLDLVDFGIFDI